MRSWTCSLLPRLSAYVCKGRTFRMQGDGNRMAAASAEWGQLATILIMAAALGMDAFSLGIGLGMRGIRLLNIAFISAVIALFHVIMPLVGIFTGRYVSTLLGDVAVAAG